jgi:5'-3' exonuclease
MVHPTDPDWRYKGDRPPKPDDFYAVCTKATEIAEMHAIPCLWAEGREADDVIATVVAQARAMGYRAWIATCDKDIHGLCEADARSGVTVGTWDPFLRSWRGPAEVRAKWGVEPRQMADLLAIAGDPGDGVPGVDGLGMGKAAAILRICGTLDAALNGPPMPDAALDAEIRGMERARTVAQREGQSGAVLSSLIKGLRSQVTSAWASLSRAEQGARRDIIKLQEHAEIARFSRDLTALDCDAPVDVPWEQTPIGGFDVEALRKRYVEIGYVRKASEVPGFPKREAWELPRR